MYVPRREAREMGRIDGWNGQISPHDSTKRKKKRGWMRIREGEKEREDYDQKGEGSSAVEFSSSATSFLRRSIRKSLIEREHRETDKEQRQNDERGELFMRTRVRKGGGEGANSDGSVDRQE